MVVAAWPAVSPCRRRADGQMATYQRRARRPCQPARGSALCALGPLPARPILPARDELWHELAQDAGVHPGDGAPCWRKASRTWAPRRLGLACQHRLQGRARAGQGHAYRPGYCGLEQPARRCWPVTPAKACSQLQLRLKRTPGMTDGDLLAAIQACVAAVQTPAAAPSCGSMTTGSWPCRPGPRPRTWARRLAGAGRRRPPAPAGPGPGHRHLQPHPPGAWPQRAAWPPLHRLRFLAHHHQRHALASPRPGTICAGGCMAGRPWWPSAASCRPGKPREAWATGGQRACGARPGRRRPGAGRDGRGATTFRRLTPTPALGGPPEDLPCTPSSTCLGAAAREESRGLFQSRWASLSEGLGAQRLGCPHRAAARQGHVPFHSHRIEGKNSSSSWKAKACCATAPSGIPQAHGPGGLPARRPPETAHQIPQHRRPPCCATWPSPPGPRPTCASIPRPRARWMAMTGPQGRRFPAQDVQGWQRGGLLRWRGQTRRPARLDACSRRAPGPASRPGKDCARRPWQTP